MSARIASRLAQRGFVFLTCVTLAGCCCYEACDIVHAPSGITCDKLRALKIGMTPDEVNAVLGPPPNGRYPLISPGPSPILWNYSNDSPIDGGVRLFVEFQDDRVTEVYSYVRTFYRDGRDNGIRPYAFRLGPGGAVEGDEFKSLYCPE